MVSSTLTQEDRAGAERSPAHAMERLIAVVQELSLARTLEAVQEIVRRSARQLTGADGASFVLRDGQQCFYADEDAIAPLWKGQRFPMQACVSGWVMGHGERVVIGDVFADDRVPADVYRPTFVRSMVMVPVRPASPIGAIGAYWAHQHAASEREVELLAALANSTSIALENVQVYAELEARVAARTAALADTNAELRRVQADKQRITDMIVHDLQNPVAGISAMLQILRRQLAHEPAAADDAMVERALRSCGELSEMIRGVLQASQAERGQLVAIVEEVELEAVVRDAVEAFREAARQGEHELVLTLAVKARVRTDPRFMRRIVQNLVRNALRHTPEGTRVEVTMMRGPEGIALSVSDDGPGVAPSLQAAIFEPFGAAALHGRGSVDTGLGLPTSRALARALGGELTITSDGVRGTTLTLTIPEGHIAGRIG